MFLPGVYFSSKSNMVEIMTLFLTAILFVTGGGCKKQPLLAFVGPKTLILSITKIFSKSLAFCCWTSKYPNPFPVELLHASWEIMTRMKKKFWFCSFSILIFRILWQLSICMQYNSMDILYKWNNVNWLSRSCLLQVHILKLTSPGPPKEVICTRNFSPELG